MTTIRPIDMPIHFSILLTLMFDPEKIREGVVPIDIWSIGIKFFSNIDVCNLIIDNFISAHLTIRYSCTS